MNITLIIYSLKDILNSSKQKINYKQLLNITTNFINVQTIELIKKDKYILKITTDYNKFVIIFKSFETLIKYIEDLQYITDYKILIGGINE